MDFRQVPIEFTKGHKIYSSKCGKIKIEDKIVKTNKLNCNKNGYYQTFCYKGNTFYVHHMVYYAHSNKSINELNNGRIIFKNITDDMVDDEKIYKCRYEDLLFEEFKNDNIEINDYLIKNIEDINKNNEDTPNENDDYYLEDNNDNQINIINIKEEEDNHPLYGKFKYGKWYNVIGHINNTSIIFEDYKLMIINDTKNGCIIKNKNNKLIQKTTRNGYDPTYHLIQNKNNYYTKQSHIILNTVFPNIKTDETVDHIDNNPKNNHINNLQWLSLSDNTSKGQKKTILIKKNKNIIDRFEMLNPNGSVRKKFKRICDITNFVIKLYKLKSFYKTVYEHIRNAIKNDGISYVHKYRKINEDIYNAEINIKNILDNYYTIIDDINTIMNDNEYIEEWKQLNINEYSKKYLISNKGRIKRNGIICQPYRSLRHGLYSTLAIQIDNNTYKKYYVHRLVWMAHKGNISDNYIVKHKYTNRITDDGIHFYERNWLCDLELGTKSENNFEYHFEKREKLINKS